jgi:hypothetical protein
MAGWEAAVPSSVLSRSKPSIKLRIARWLGLLCVLAFTVLGVIYVDKSMDLPWPEGPQRYGFYGNQLPTHWVCGDGHDHYSLPFWFGGLLCAIPTALWWLVWPRKKRG